MIKWIFSAFMAMGACGPMAAGEADAVSSPFHTNTLSAAWRSQGGSNQNPVTREGTLHRSQVHEPPAIDPIQKPCISREQIERCRSLVEKLPPDERLLKIQEWRDNHGGITNRLLHLLKNLRDKKAQDGLSSDEALRLERLETVAKRFEQSRFERRKKSGDIPLDHVGPNHK